METPATPRRRGRPPLVQSNSVPQNGTDPETPPATPPESLTAVLESEEDARILALVQSEEGSQAVLEVSRLDRVTGKHAYLFNVPVAEWGPHKKDEIAREHGGGEYKARIRYSDNRAGQSFPFSIDRSIKPLHERNAIVPVAPDFEKQFEKLALMLREKGEEKSMGTMMMFMKMQSEMMMAFINRPQPQAIPPSEKLIEVLATRALQPPPPPAFDIDKLTGVIAAVSKIAKGGDRDGGERGEGSGVWGAILEALPVVLGALKQIAPPPLPAIPESAAPTAAPPQQSQTIVTPPPAPVSPPREEDPQRAALSVFLPQLVAQFKSGVQPADIARHLFDNLDEQNFETITGLLSRDDWFQVLGDVDQTIYPYSNQFAELRGEFLKLSQEDRDAGGEPSS